MKSENTVDVVELTCDDNIAVNRVCGQRSGVCCGINRNIRYSDVHGIYALRSAGEISLPRGIPVVMRKKDRERDRITMTDLKGEVF